LSKKKTASILIINYNNKKYIDECIKSIINQTYKNLEIIFHDDCSNDGSLEIAQKYKKVKIIKRLSRGKYGSYNQMKAYERAFKKSSGEIIFLLDSDDYFHKKKVKNIINIFNKNDGLKVIYDLPILKLNKKLIFKKNRKKFIKNIWPYIPPQSCISIRRDFFLKILKGVNFNRFPDIWMDFRFAIYLLYINKSFFVYEKNLTFYRQILSSESSKFQYLSASWWKRRKQAFEYIKYFFNKNNLKYKNNIDFYLTTIVSKFCN
tara:strand:- start:2160 stop:2945 length:786 start_codon:yes stop_codon:yes gene_type:complete